MSNDKVSIIFEALVGSSTKATFTTLTQGFQKFAKGLRLSAVELKKMQQTQASEALGHMALNVDKVVQEFGKFGKSAKRTTTHLSELEQAFKHLSTAEGETGKEAKKLLADFKHNGKGFTETANALKRLNIDYKITAQTQKFLATETGIVSERWKALIPTIGRSSAEFTNAVRKTNNFVTAIHNLKIKVNDSGGSLIDFKKNLSYAKIEAGIADKHIRLVGTSFQVLTKEGYKAIGVTEKNITAFRKITEGLNVYEKAIRQAGEANKPLLTAMLKLKNNTNLSVLTFTRYSKSLLESEKAIDALKNKLNETAAVKKRVLSVIDRGAIAIRAEAGDLKILANGFKIINKDGLTPFKHLTMEAAGKLGMLGDKFKTLTNTENELARATNKSIEVIKKQSVAMFNSGKTIDEMVVTLGKELKALSASAAKKVQLQEKSEMLIRSNRKLLVSTHGLTAAQVGQQRAIKDLIMLMAQGKGDIKLMTEEVLNQVKAFKENIAETRRTTVERKKNIEGARTLARDYSHLTHAVKTDTAAMAALRIKIVGLVRDLKKNNIGAKEATSKMKLYGREMQALTPKATLLSQALTRLGKSFKTYSSYLISSRVLMGLADSFRAGTTAILEHDQALHDLKAIMNATDTEVRMLDKTLLNVASATKFSIGEVAQAMKRFGQAGFTASESMAGMQDIASLATGTLEGLEETVNLVTTAVRVFQLGMDQTGLVADVFANAVNKSRLTLHKLNIAFNYIGPLAKAAGLSLKDTTAAMMLLANAGVRASTTGTGLRRVIAGLMNPSKALADGIKEAGYELDDFNPLMNDFSDIVKRLPGVVGDAGDAIRMFGIRGSAVVSAFATQGSSEFDRLRDTLDRVGSASEMAEEQMRGLQNMLKNVKDRFGILAKTLAEGGILEIFRALVSSTQWLLKALTALAGSGIGKAVLQFTLLSTVLVGAIALTGQFSLLMKAKLIPAFINGMIAATGFTTALSATAAAEFAATSATLTFGGALKLMVKNLLSAAAASLAFIATPIGWVLAAIGLAVGAVTFAWSMYKKHLKSVQETQLKLSNDIGTTTAALDKYLAVTEKHGINSVKAADSAKVLRKSMVDLGEQHGVAKEIVDKFTGAIDEETGVLLVSTTALKEYTEELGNAHIVATLKAVDASAKLYTSEVNKKKSMEEVKTTLKKLAQQTQIYRTIQDGASLATGKWIPQLQNFSATLDEVFDSGTAHQDFANKIAAGWTSMLTAIDPAIITMEEAKEAWKALDKAVKDGTATEVQIQRWKEITKGAAEVAVAFLKTKEAAELTDKEILAFQESLAGEYNAMGINAIGEALTRIRDRAVKAAATIQGQLGQSVKNLKKEMRALANDGEKDFQAFALTVDSATAGLLEQTVRIFNELGVEYRKRRETHKRNKQELLAIDAWYYEQLTSLVDNSSIAYQKMLAQKKAAFNTSYAEEIANLENYYAAQSMLEQNATDIALAEFQEALQVKLTALKGSIKDKGLLDQASWEAEKEMMQQSLEEEKEHYNEKLLIAETHEIRKKQLLSTSGATEKEQAISSVKITIDTYKKKLAALNEYKNKHASVYDTLKAKVASLTAEMQQDAKQGKDVLKGIADAIVSIQEHGLSAEDKVWKQRIRVRELNAEAVILIQKGEFGEAKKLLKEAITLETQRAKAAVDAGKEGSAAKYGEISGLEKLGTTYETLIAAEAKFKTAHKENTIKSMEESKLKVNELNVQTEGLIKTLQTLGNKVDMEGMFTSLAELQKELDNLIIPKSVELDFVDKNKQPLIDALNKIKEAYDKIESKTVVINVVTKEVKSIPKPADVPADAPKDKKADGGRIPGYGGGDKEDILVEKGEWVIQKEAVQHYGDSFMSDVNNMMYEKRKFADGGSVTKKKKEFTEQSDGKMGWSDVKSGSTEKSDTRSDAEQSFDREMANIKSGKGGDRADGSAFSGGNAFYKDYGSLSKSMAMEGKTTDIGRLMEMEKEDASRSKGFIVNPLGENKRHGVYLLSQPRKVLQNIDNVLREIVKSAAVLRADNPMNGFGFDPVGTGRGDSIASLINDLEAYPDTQAYDASPAIGEKLIMDTEGLIVSLKKLGGMPMFSALHGKLDIPWDPMHKEEKKDTSEALKRAEDIKKGMGLTSAGSVFDALSSFQQNAAGSVRSSGNEMSDMIGLINDARSKGMDEIVGNTTRSSSSFYQDKASGDSQNKTTKHTIDFTFGGGQHGPFEGSKNTVNDFISALMLAKERT